MKKIVSVVLAIFIFGGLFAKTVKVGYYIDGGNVMYGYSEEDARGGFAYEYLQNVASYTDWEFEYVYGYWNTLYDKLLSGEIDILTDVSYSKERENLFYYPTFSMGQENYFLYANRHNTEILADDLTSLNGKTIELSQGSYQYDLFEAWLKKNNINLDVTLIPHEEFAEKDFNEGKYDLFLSIDLVSDFNWEPIAKVGSSEIYVVVSKKRPDLLGELNEAQTQLYLSEPYYNYALWVKYFSNTATTKKLTAKEKKWLDSKRALNIGCFTNDFLYSPQNFINDGSGLVGFVLKNLKQQLDLPDLQINYKYYETRAQIVNALKSGEIDMAFPFLYDLNATENEGLSVSKTVLPISFSYLFVDGTSYEDIPKTVALIKGNRASEFFESHELSKNSEIKYFDNMEQCLTALLVKRASGAVVSTSEATAFIYGREKYKNIKMIDLDFSELLCFAADNQNPNAISLINKTISLINKNDLQSEFIKYSVSDNQYTFYDFLNDYSVLIITGILLMAVLIVALVVSLKYINVLMNYDAVTHLFTRRVLDKYIENYVNSANEKNEDFSMIIFDLDDFKYINEKFGHETGDEVLKLTSEIILKGVSAKDKVFRWGDGEFLAIVQADKERAINIANRIRENIAVQQFVKSGRKFFVTVSGGISTFKSGKLYTQMLIEAEENLYEGKTQGKNVIIS